MSKLVNKVDPFKDGSGVALYQFDGNANDAGGNYNGTLTSGITEDNDGKFGSALHFPANNTSKVDLSQHPINNTDTYSISAWVKISNIGFFGLYCCNVEGWKKYGIEFYAYNPNIVFSHVRSDSIASNNKVQISQKADNVWHHYVAVRNGLVIQLYEDGIKVDENTLIVNETANYHLPYMGAYTNNNTNTPQVENSLDQVRIFNRVLTAEEVSYLYKEIKPSKSFTRSNTF